MGYLKDDSEIKNEKKKENKKDKTVAKGKNHFIKKRLLSLQITLSIVIVVVVLTVIQSSIALNSMNQSTDYAVKSSLDDMALETALQVETQMKYSITEAQAVSNLLCREEMSEQNRKDTLSFSHSRYDFSQIIFIDPKGKNIDDGEDFSGSDIYKKALTGELALSDATKEDKSQGVSKYTFQIGVPIIKNGLPSGSLQGVLLATSGRDALGDMIKKIKIVEQA